VPIGSSGELYIGGAGLTRGYLKRPELTAERFIPHPFSHEPGARLYQTGDLARYLPDGNLELLGRLDHQVQLRGVRIELGEVEAALRRHTAIRQAIVLAREDTIGDVRLVAYLVVDPSSRPTISALRLFLKTILPDYMAPSTWVIMDALPTTPSGKVDRRALPVPSGLRPELIAAYEAPRTQVEQTLAAAWQEVLHVENVGIHDNFFDLGGYSLLMTQIYSQLQEDFRKSFSMIDMFKYPTISSLADYLSQQYPQPSSFQKSYDRAQLRLERIQQRHQFDNNTD
jgi:non-ribosomal peptide synthetase component F